MLLKAFAWGMDSYFKAAFSKTAPPVRTEVVINRPERKLEAFVYPAADDVDNPSIIALFHGGGWLHGNTWQLAGFAQNLSKLGYTVYVPAYRVAVWDGATVADGLSDVAAFWQWLCERHADSSLYLGGQSAGAFLAAHVGLTASVKPQALLLLNPAAGLEERKIKWSWPILGQPRGYKPDDLLSLDPINYMGAEMPPIFLAHGVQDFVVPIRWPRRFASAVKAHGGACEMIELDGYGHGFANPHLFPNVCRRVIDKMDGFIQRCSDKPTVAAQMA